MPGELIGFTAEVGKTGIDHRHCCEQVDNQSNKEMSGSFLNLVEVCVSRMTINCVNLLGLSRW